MKNRRAWFVMAAAMVVLLIATQDVFAQRKAWIQKASAKKMGAKVWEVFDHEPKRKPRRSRRGQARQSFYGAEGSPNLWRRSPDRKVGASSL